VCSAGTAGSTCPTTRSAGRSATRAKVTVIDSKYGDPWLLEECRVCGRRYQARSYAGKLDPAVDWKDVARQRVEVARRDPGMFARNISGRGDYEGRTLQLGVELVGHPKRSFLDNLGFRLHFGGRGSETPIDASVHVGLASAYFSVGGVGGRFCEWLGRGHGRDLSIRTHSGKVWWKLWYDDAGGNDSYHRCDSWRQPKLWPWSRGRKKHRGWMCLRDGNLDLNPLDAMWGSRKFHYEDLSAKRSAFVSPTPGERYLVDFTLRRQTRFRDHGPSWARRPDPKHSGFVVEWFCETGIPIRNHTWKGNNVLGSAVHVDAGPDGLWLEEAVRAVEADIVKDRKHHGYREEAAL
jgi:hypothetical protein